MTEYRIDDLARAAGTTVRNVRGYQDRGLIPRPIRRGRIAIYTDQHLQRLRVIGDLLKRGFTMAHISDFLSGVQRGDDLMEVLGLKGLLTEPIARTPTEQVSRDKLFSYLGDPEPGLLQQIQDFGLVEPAGDDEPPTSYLIKDTETLDAYRELLTIGVPLTYILGLQRQLDDDLQQAASTLITAGRRAVTEGRFDGWIPERGAEEDWAASFIRQLRRTGRVTAHNTLNRALDRELTRQLDDYLAIAKFRRTSEDPPPAPTP
ncbi:MAG: MerR family transcriptional regulator [Gordonia sp. (in: high G+C Gram-positive bacteria)]|uniref:MerR family transcriptional regulator n=1 Tax=Gordonia sp. (in: high G+C Gram-positive bacteria) TaxID=84139 RepID=UPI003BB49061